MYDLQYIACNRKYIKCNISYIYNTLYIHMSTENENAYPDYKHPAVYNTTTHTALDQSPESNTSDNWMIISKYKSTFTSSAQSIEDLDFGNSIASFRLSEPISINQKDISLRILEKRVCFFSFTDF